jgi:uncharacterized membrane protein
MHLYFDRKGKYRGYSMTLGAWLVVVGVVIVLALALGRVLFYLSPVIAIWGLVIWLGRGEIRSRRARRADKTQQTAEEGAATSRKCTP